MKADGQPGADAPAGTPSRPLRNVFILKAFTPRVFDGKDQFLQRNGLELVNDPARADILIGRRVRDFKPAYLALDRLNVVWTHEPFFASESSCHVRVDGRSIHVFDVYAGNVYTDVFFDFRGKHVPKVKAGSLNVPFDNRQAVAVMTRKALSAVVDGRDRSLLPLRENLALAGHAAGQLDIFGGGWPGGMSRGDSRHAGGRREAKRQILSGYNFSLCLENCLYDNYVTEKLWEAIAAHCLPIVMACDTLRAFPPIEAAILVNRHPDWPSIRAEIERMTEAEYVERLNALIAFHNHAHRNRLGNLSRARTKERFAAFLAANR